MREKEGVQKFIEPPEIYDLFFSVNNSLAELYTHRPVITPSTQPQQSGTQLNPIGSLFMLVGTMFSNFIGNGYNFLSEIPLISLLLLQ